jgi:hypothetical protein
MCDFGISLMVASLAATALSTVSQVRQQKAQAQAAQKAADYNSQVAANEAATRQQLAQLEIEKAAEQRDRVNRAGLAHQGELRAAMGGSGFTLDSGTNLSLLGQSAEEIGQDMSKVSQEGATAAWQHLAAITGLNNQAAYGQWEAANAKSQSKMAQTGTILGGLASGLSATYTYGQDQGWFKTKPIGNGLMTGEPNSYTKPKVWG